MQLWAEWGPVSGRRTWGEEGLGMVGSGNKVGPYSLAMLCRAPLYIVVHNNVPYP